MPYPGQVAGKTGHFDLLRNPDIAEFLGRCLEVPRPTPEEMGAYFSAAHAPASLVSSALPDTVLAIDGSSYEAAPDGRYPSRLIGYVKISSIGLDITRYRGLRTPTSRFVDPLEVNRIKDDVSALAMALPSAYVVPRACASSKEGFRREVLTYLRSEATKLGGTSLYDSLVVLAEIMGEVRGTSGKKEIEVNCANDDCVQSDGKSSKVWVPVTPGMTKCPGCGEVVVATDILRCHEAFMDSSSNVQALNRLMNVIEHVLMAHYVLYAWRENKRVLSNLCIISDGPLAIFGEAAKFHRGMMGLLGRVRDDLARSNLPEPIFLGFTKTGRLVEHFAMVSHVVTENCPDGVVFPISDEYRYKFIEPAKDPTVNHGKDTYYGQDFFVRTARGHDFIVGMPYPFAAKGAGFQQEKVELPRYQNLGRALKVITEFESELYGDSLIPITLAHQHASISLKPGGKVLDIMSRRAMPES